MSWCENCGEHEENDDEPWRVKEERSREETDDDPPLQEIEVAGIALLKSLTELADVIAGEIVKGRSW